MNNDWAVCAVLTLVIFLFQQAHFEWVKVKLWDRNGEVKTIYDISF